LPRPSLRLARELAGPSGAFLPNRGTKVIVKGEANQRNAFRKKHLIAFFSGVRPSCAAAGSNKTRGGLECGHRLFEESLVGKEGSLGKASNCKGGS
jgi:hypothetical protein